VSSVPIISGLKSYLLLPEMQLPCTAMFLCYARLEDRLQLAYFRVITYKNQGNRESISQAHTRHDRGSQVSNLRISSILVMFRRVGSQSDRKISPDLR
jgi:hypothetical protein